KVSPGENTSCPSDGSTLFCLYTGVSETSTVKVLTSSSLFAKTCEGNISAAANTEIATVVSGTVTTANFVRGRLPFHETRAALYTRPARLRVNSIVFFIGVLSIPRFLARFEAVDRVAFTRPTGSFRYRETYWDRYWRFRWVECHPDRSCPG